MGVARRRHDAREPVARVVTLIELVIATSLEGRDTRGSDEQLAAERMSAIGHRLRGAVAGAVPARQRRCRPEEPVEGVSRTTRRSTRTARITGCPRSDPRAMAPHSGSGVTVLDAGGSLSGGSAGVAP